MCVDIDIYIYRYIYNIYTYIYIYACMYAYTKEAISHLLLAMRFGLVQRPISSEQALESTILLLYKGYKGTMWATNEAFTLLWLSPTRPHRP